MKRRDLLLAILAAADGQTYSPVQLQKAVFLVTRNLPELIDEGNGFGFVPYDYGPFDLSVYTEAERLQEKDLLNIGRVSGGRWKCYSATDGGVKRGKKLLDAMSDDQRSYITDVSRWVRKQDFGSLVKSIYEAYPEMRANSVFRG